MNDPIGKGPHWLFWDGDCGFCRQCVAWLGARDRQGAFLTMPYQAAPSPPMTAALRERCREAVCVVKHDKTELFAGRAVAFVVGEIGYRRLSWLMSSPTLGRVVEWGYRRVANNRGLIGKLLFRKSR